MKTIYNGTSFRTINKGELIEVHHNGCKKYGIVSTIFKNGKIRIKFSIWPGYVDYTPDSDGINTIPFLNK